MEFEYSIRTKINEHGKIIRQYGGAIKRDGRIQHFQGPYYDIPEVEKIESQHDELIKMDAKGVRKKGITTIVIEEEND